VSTTVLAILKELVKHNIYGNLRKLFGVFTKLLGHNTTNFAWKKGE
jgi:hypothetical protein